MATGYAGYQGYGDPDRVKAERARKLAETLQQNVQNNQPRNLVSGLAGLAEAFIAKDADTKAATAENAYGDVMKERNARLASSLMPDATGIANEQLDTAAPFDLTPNAMTQRRQQGGENARYRPIVEALLGEGNLGGAVGFVGDQQQLAAQRAEAARKANEPKIYNQPNGIFAVTPDLKATLIEGTQPTPEPTKLPEGMWYGQDGKGPPQPIPGYEGMRARIAAAGRAPAANDGNFRNLSAQETEQRGYPRGTVVQVDGQGREFVRSRPSTAQTGQPTESERAAGLHAQVSLNGLRQLMAMEGEGYNRAGVAEQLFGSTFGLEKERLYDQSADEFIDGYLRAMTGAAATKQEVENYKQQWFPKWGDTPAVIAQKSTGRLNAIQAMKSKAGRSWNPSWDAMLNQMQGGNPSASPMPLATERGSETVPGMNWNAAQMDYRSPSQTDDLSQMSTEDLERMLAEAEGQ